MQLLQSLGSYVGEYPDIILGPQRGDEIPPEELDPAILLARINVALEGFALTTFEEIRELAEQTGEELVEHCHDYNMADEVTHVGIGDYWLEKLSEEQPWRKERAPTRPEGVRAGASPWSARWRCSTSGAMTRRERRRTGVAPTLVRLHCHLTN